MQVAAGVVAARGGDGTIAVESLPSWNDAGEARFPCETNGTERWTRASRPRVASFARGNRVRRPRSTSATASSRLSFSCPHLCLQRHVIRFARAEDGQFLLRDDRARHAEFSYAAF